MPTQNSNLNTTWTINTSNDTWTLAESATITTEGEDGVLVGLGFTGNDIRIDGDVIRTGGIYNVEVRGDDNHFFIGKHAQIGGAPINKATVGIGFLSASGSVDNAGIISGKLTGIFTSAGTDIVNTGKVEGINAIYAGDADLHVDNSGKLLGEKFGITLHDAGAGASIVNRTGGLIKSGETGVDFADAAATTLKNFGTISGPLAISAGDGETQIINRGTIHGDVALGGGEDRFDTRGGTVSGKVDGGEGNDTYLVGSQSIAIAEHLSSGNDLVKSTVTCALAKNLENLILLGHNDADGTGNGGNNSLFGNLGDNILRGLGGSDDLSGGKGDDILTGGKGADLFVFNNGDGHDVITDFQNGHDVIFSNFVGDESDFDLMVNHHLTVKGDDLLLHDNNDSLLIRNMDIADLDYSDFFTGP